MLRVPAVDYNTARSQLAIRRPAVQVVVGSSGVRGHIHERRLGRSRSGWIRCREGARDRVEHDAMSGPNPMSMDGHPDGVKRSFLRAALRWAPMSVGSRWNGSVTIFHSARIQRGGKFTQQENPSAKLSRQRTNARNITSLFVRDRVATPERRTSPGCRRARRGRCVAAARGEEADRLEVRRRARCQAVVP